MSKVFINRRVLSDEAAAAMLALYPNGGSYSEESVYRKIRKITVDMLPKGCGKTPTQIRNEIDKLISEEMTIQIAVEGLTCEKCERKINAEDEHQKAMKKMADLAKKEHEEAKAKAEKKEEPKPNATAEEPKAEEKTESKEPEVKKAPAKKSVRSAKKKPASKKKK